MRLALNALKFFCCAVLVLIVSFIVGDELHQRIERMELRNICYESQATQLSVINDYLDFRIKQMCRINIP